MVSFQSMVHYVRRQPESVRTKYFLSSFGISVLFVLTLWAFSTKESLSKIAESETEANTLKEFRDATKANIPPDSLKNIMDAGKTLNEETKNMLNKTNSSEQNIQEDTPSQTEEEGKKVFTPPTEEGINNKNAEKSAKTAQEAPQNASENSKP